jgi:hypothetical protein
MFIRSVHRQRELEEMFGPGFFDRTVVQRHWETWLGIAFVVYHMPMVWFGLIVVAVLKLRRPILMTCLVIVLTATTYTTLVVWLWCS